MYLKKKMNNIDIRANAVSSPDCVRFFFNDKPYRQTYEDRNAFCFYEMNGKIETHQGGKHYLCVSNAIARMALAPGATVEKLKEVLMTVKNCGRYWTNIGGKGFNLISMWGDEQVKRFVIGPSLPYLSDMIPRRSGLYEQWGVDETPQPEDYEKKGNPMYQDISQKMPENWKDFEQRDIPSDKESVDINFIYRLCSENNLDANLTWLLIGTQCYNLGELQNNKNGQITISDEEMEGLRKAGKFHNPDRTDPRNMIAHRRNLQGHIDTQNRKWNKRLKYADKPGHMTKAEWNFLHRLDENIVRQIITETLKQML